VRSETRPSVQNAEAEKTSFIEAARRAQIITCAIETIAALGFQRASLYEIAKRARVSKSVISYYFDSKDDLIRQVVAEIYATAKSFMVPRVEAAEGSAANMLRAFIRANVAWLGQHSTQVLAIMEIARGFRPAGGPPPFEEDSMQSVADLESLMRYGQQSGEFREFDPAIMAAVLRLTLDALAPRIANATGAELDHFADEIIDLFEAATAAPTSQRRKGGTA
jgi:AcrR family transcriptional regulator